MTALTTTRARSFRGTHTQGRSPEELRELALGLLRATLSAAGYQTARDVMRLNHTLAEISGGWDELGEWMYWVSLFGTPSEHQPWGWQIDGHHLNLNCFVLGGQVVLSPAFMGSEPVVAENGKFAGTRVFDAEEQAGLALGRSPTASERAAAVAHLQRQTERFAQRPDPQLALGVLHRSTGDGFQPHRLDVL